MALLFLSLVFIFANVEGQDGGFQSFNQYNVDSVHAPPFQDDYPGINPLGERIFPNLGILRNSPLFHQEQRPTFTNSRSSLFSDTGNIVQQSKALAESAKSLFKSLENITLVPELFDHVFETSGCLGNLEDAIELMDESNKLISQNGPEIIYLEAIVDNLMNEKNVTKLLRASAKMLRILEDLIPKLKAKSSKICISSPTDSVEDFKSLAHLLRDVMNHRDIDLPEEQRQLIELSSKIMADVAKFLVILNKSVDTFDSICNDGMTKDVGVFNSIGDIMASLAALFDVLGLEKKSMDIKKQGDFLKKIVVAFHNIDEFNSSLECGAYEAYGTLALTLDDLAEIVHSVGIEALSKELGVDLDFINDV